MMNKWSGPMNYGFSGLAITLPKVWQRFDVEISDTPVAMQAKTVVTTLVDLTEGVYVLGNILHYDCKRHRIYNRETNNETYYDYSSTVSFIKRKIGTLMNNVLIIGETALSLLETMWIHAYRTTKDDVDELAFMLAEMVYDRVMDDR